MSALIPVYNAESYIEGKLQSLLALNYPKDKLQIIVASDCSDDGSDEIIKSYSNRFPSIEYHRMETRSGKPTLVNFMAEKAKGEILLMTDIRQPLVPDALRELVVRLADPAVGAVSGNLVLHGSEGVGFYWKYENKIREAEGQFRSMIGVTGPIYAIRKKELSVIPEDMILDDMWIPLSLRLKGKKIVFAKEAIATDDTFGDEREFGRKVRTLAGNYQLFSNLRDLLNPFKNPSWFETVSHKICRLLCPWALVGLFVFSLMGSFQTGCAMSKMFCFASFTGLCSFLVLAFLGGKIGAPGRIARTFMVLNWAAVVGLSRFLKSSQKVTW